MTTPSLPHRPRMLGLLLLLAAGPASASAQTAGSSGAAAVGAALGGVAGATFAAVGSIFPCTRTYAGAKCVRTSSIMGTALGLASGMAIGSGNLEEVERMATGAAIGFAIGSGVGLVVKKVVLYSTWGDVVATGAIGMAVGTSPEGALIGLGAGAIVGMVAWQLIPRFDLVNATDATLLGMTIGGIGSLVLRGFQAQAEGTAQTVTLPINIRF
ncbi:MAG: hypothetical protein V3R71_09155 [Gemmatimonadales bacterium]